MIDVDGKGWYMEKQDEGFCPVHTLNAMVGRKLLTGEELIEFCQNQQSIDPRAWHQGLQWRSNMDGWFANVAVNAWLYEHANGDACFKLGGHLSPTTAKDRLLSLPPACTSCMLTTTTTIDGQEILHAVCLKRDPANRHIWYQIDSMCYPKVQPLITDADYAAISGKIHVL
jgi:hypothetical protein